MFSDISFNNISFKPTVKGSKFQNASKFDYGEQAIRDIVDINFEEAKKKQKEKYIENSKILSEYNQRAKSDINEHADTINVLDLVDLEGLKEIEKACEGLYEDIETERPYTRETILKNYIDLYYYDKEAFEYCLDSDVMNDIYMDDALFNSCISNLSLGTIKEIEKGGLNLLMLEYIEESDAFCENPEKVDELSEFLSQNKVEKEFSVYRGERSVGIFSEIPLDNPTLTRKIKFSNFVNQKHTRKENFVDFDKRYHTYSESYPSLYEHIKNKKDLSIADAMLMMKYMDKTSQKEILEAIENAEIEDDKRFKSTSISKEFPEIWISSVYNSNRKHQPKIMSKMNLKEGVEGLYARKETKDINTQREFIINNTPKKTTIKGVSFDEEKNLFNIEFDVEPA